ncbi:MAG: hypothetical protein JXR10_00915 [Cyclobacteriaceae bacterium]
MKRISIIAITCTLLLSAKAQESTSLGATIDELTYKWDTEAENLNSYNGLTEFCVDKEYRTELIGLLNDIHHYDSVLYDRLVKAQRFKKDKEIEKTLKDISKFEDKYSMKKLIHFLHEECNARKDIEKNADESRNDFGANSYSGQIYIVETELNKYIKHITKRVDHLRKHVHHLHIK